MSDTTRDLLANAPAIVNVGLPEFFQSLVDQGARVIHVDWQPAASGDQEMMDLLDGLL